MRRKSAQSEAAGLSKRSVNEKKRIALSERTSEVGQSTGATRMPPLKGNVILISSM
jgi:hypothetical protein